MKRRNGLAHQTRMANVDYNAQFMGRLTCRSCNRLVPRGSDRPFCLDHADYAQKLMQEIAARELEEQRMAQAAVIAAQAPAVEEPGRDLDDGKKSAA